MTSSTPNIVHGLFAFGSLVASIASLIISIKLGTLEFIQRNLIGGLCKDVWNGFFLSPKHLIGLGFLFYLPIHCYLIRAPSTILCITMVMGLPSFLFIIASCLEIFPVVLPIGVLIGSFGNFGLAEFHLARQVHPQQPVSKITHTSSLKHYNHKHSSQPLISPKSTRHHQNNSLNILDDSHHPLSPSSSLKSKPHQIPISSEFKKNPLTSTSVSKRKRRES